MKLSHKIRTTRLEDEGAEQVESAEQKGRQTEQLYTGEANLTAYQQSMATASSSPIPLATLDPVMKFDPVVTFCNGMSSREIFFGFRRKRLGVTLNL